MTMTANSVIIALPPYFHQNLNKSYLIEVLTFKESYKETIKMINKTERLMDNMLYINYDVIKRGCLMESTYKKRGKLTIYLGYSP
ncbi:hypothetical protein, partial [Staphylococcus aureus]|uniref:hypothetical protein n=1 Tax=Staphylococcus aureus TaxID=1280 RepID=UPI001D0D79B7